MKPSIDNKSPGKFLFTISMSQPAIEIDTLLFTHCNPQLALCLKIEANMNLILLLRLVNIFLYPLSLCVLKNLFSQMRSNFVHHDVCICQIYHQRDL